MPGTASYIFFAANVVFLAYLLQVAQDAGISIWLPFGSSSNATLDHLAHFHHRVPYTSAWSSWWHPQRVASHLAGDEEKHGYPTQDGGRHTNDWNIFYHLGGNGPWVQKLDGVAEGGIKAPKGCVVNQVHMMSRHAERYPTAKAGRRMLKMLDHLKSSGVDFKGDLAFVNKWEYFSKDPQHDHEHLTRTGPYAGTLGAFTAGTKLRTRYSNLLDALPDSTVTNFWACGCNRVIDTARHFSAGFFGLNYTQHAKLNIIPEDADRGANTLTPGDTCKAYLTDPLGHDQGYGKLHAFRATYLSATRQRFKAQNPGIELSDEELYAMQELCGFETTIRGSSPWCSVFTRDEWLSFEYARDIIHYYRAGPGTPYGAPMGWLYLKAVVDLMQKGPEKAGSMFFSFVHDGDIIPLMAALQLYDDKEHLTVTHRPEEYNLHTSTITPMGGRVIFERMTCDIKGKNPGKSKKRHDFVRININDGIVPFPGCESGPGRSCPLERFARWTAMRGVQVGDFREVCGLEKDAPAKIEFLRQN